MDKHAVTVVQLVSMLQALPTEAQTMPVWLEGCDCINQATQPRMDSNRVLIGADVGYAKAGAPTADEIQALQAERTRYLQQLGLLRP